jgi:hypothetical protein
VCCHLVLEWVSGQGFLNTEAERGPRWATEKRAQSSGEALSSNKATQAILRTKRTDVEQQADWKTAHVQIGLQLHVMHGQQCGTALVFQDDGFVRQNIGPVSKR